MFDYNRDEANGKHRKGGDRACGLQRLSAGTRPAQAALDHVGGAGEFLLDRAEEYRKRIAIEWLGEELPPSVGQVMVNVSYSDRPDSGLIYSVASIFFIIGWRALGRSNLAEAPRYKSTSS